MKFTKRLRHSIYVGATDYTNAMLCGVSGICFAMDGYTNHRFHDKIYHSKYKLFPELALFDNGKSWFWNNDEKEERLLALAFMITMTE